MLREDAEHHAHLEIVMNCMTDQGLVFDKTCNGRLYLVERLGYQTAINLVHLEHDMINETVGYRSRTGQCDEQKTAGLTSLFEVCFPHPAPLRSIVDDTFSLSNEGIEDDRTVEIDYADARQRRFRSLGPNANHFTVEREIFSGSEKLREGEEGKSREDVRHFRRSV